MDNIYFQIVKSDDPYVFDTYIDTTFSKKFNICRCDSILDGHVNFHAKNLFDSRKKCYICDNVKELDLIFDNLDNLISGKFQNYNVIVYKVENIDKRSKLYKRHKNLIFEPILSIDTICENILNEKISNDLLNKLFNKCNSNISKFVFELYKIKHLFNSNYVKSLEEAINIILSNIDFNCKVDTFKFIDAIISKDLEQIKNYIKQLNLSQFDFGFSTLLYNSFHNLFIIKDAGDKANSTNTGLSQFVINSLRDNCKIYSIEKLNNILGILFNIDKDIKSGNLDSSYAYDLLLVRLLS